MAAIIEFELPPEEFALEETLRKLPEVRLEIARVVADAPDQITPYLWVRADDFEEFEAAVEADPTVESVTKLSETDEERSYQMMWTGSIDFVVQLVTEHDGTITHADGSGERWRLRAVFPDRDALSRAYNSAQDAGYRFDVREIYGTEDTRHIQHGLTEKQRNTMVAAFEEGYFEVPRKVTLTEFAEHQNRSHQAVSEQLRRATGQLVDSTLVSHSEEEDE